MAQSYEKAGVNLEAGYEVVRRIKKHVASTSRPGVMGNIGAFGGMFDLSALNVKEPVLVSGTDGVGTKLKLAFEMDKHDTIGIDAVAMCVNDVLAQGAEPLEFLDYVAVGRNEPQKVEAIVAGVADGCRQAGCALVGGETAEMPGMYAEGEYDIAGFTVGVVEKSQLIDGSKVKVSYREATDTWGNRFDDGETYSLQYPVVDMPSDAIYVVNQGYQLPTGYEVKLESTIGIPGTGLLDAINENTHMTVIISDNLTTGMTGGQDSQGTGKLEEICLGLGAAPEHVRTIDSLPRNVEQMKALFKEEIDYPGLSVIVSRRECIQTARRHAKKK